MAVTALRPPNTPPAALPAVKHLQGDVLRLSLLALGVIYGDIGTSPLYAIRECFYGAHGIGVSHANVLGVLSLVFWTLIIVVTLKYHLYVIRAHNKGEGGILALVALVSKVLKRGRIGSVALALGLFGAALLYADGALTPAISVLSAVEGLSIATNVFDPYIVPITIAVLVGLFMVQHHGTGGVGAVFGPIMLLWFGTLAVLGISGIVREPGVLAAVNPWHAAHFLMHNGMPAFIVLGAVFLVATGGEALYADLGHFSHKAVQIDWFCLVGPALVLNYFGQGALLLTNPRCGGEPLLPARAVVGFVSACGAGDGRDHHRIAGDHYRRVLFDDAGSAAWISAARQDRAYLREDNRADLHRLGELAVDDSDNWIGGWFRKFERDGWRVWHCDCDHNGDHDVVSVSGGVEVVGLAVACGAACDDRVPED